MNNQQPNPDQGPGPRLLDVDASSRSLGVSRWTMYRLINRREIKTVQIEGRRLIAREDLDEYIERLRHPEGSLERG